MRFETPWGDAYPHAVRGQVLLARRHPRRPKPGRRTRRPGRPGHRHRAGQLPRRAAVPGRRPRLVPVPGPLQGGRDRGQRPAWHPVRTAHGLGLARPVPTQPRRNTEMITRLAMVIIAASPRHAGTQERSGGSRQQPIPILGGKPMSTPTAQPVRRRLAAIAAAAAVALLAGAGPAAAQAAGGRAVSGGTWGKAREVAGLAALNQGGFANITSVSCASAGSCTAGGSYTDSSGGGQAFVVSEVNGSWGQAKEVPGLAALNQGGSALLTSVSCARAGTCAAGGSYTDGSGGQQAFVASETNGHWGKAKEIPGTAALNQGGSAFTGSVSCARAGTCAAGGWYTDGAGGQQAFVVSAANGTWGTAEEVPGTAALNTGGYAGIQGGYFFGGAVSCAAAGTCAAGGWYTDSTGSQQAFVVSEANGRWGTAQEVPGTAALNQAGSAGTNSVSCTRAGTCTAAGSYSDGSGAGQAFVATQTNGTWGTAEQVPGIAALNQGGNAVPVSVSCARAGSCAVGGFYKDGSGHYQAFVVTKTNGTWGTAQEIPGTAALNQGGHAFTNSVSCASAGTCAAGGFYFDSSGHRQAFVVTESNGTWGTAQEVPGTAALNQGGNAETLSVSCAPAG